MAEDIGGTHRSSSVASTEDANSTAAAPATETMTRRSLDLFLFPPFVRRPGFLRKRSFILELGF